MERLFICKACQAIEYGLKTRIAIPHTCELGFQSMMVDLFYAIENEDEPEAKEKSLNHKWGGWGKEYVDIPLRMVGVRSKESRKCLVCGAVQTKTFYKNQSYPDMEVNRNGREGVDCNPELSQ